MRSLNKKITPMIVLIITCLLVIAACSNRNIVTNTSDEEDDQSTETLGEKYGFTFFQLTADTKDMKIAIDAIYDEKRDKTEAMYESKIDDLYLYGNEAMEKLDSIFEELALEPEMDDEDMIKKASESFEIIDYESLKLNVKFKGHDTKELMMTK